MTGKVGRETVVRVAEVVVEETNAVGPVAGGTMTVGDSICGID